MSAPAASATLKACAHCGTPFHPRKEDDRFCCGGCAYVYQLLHEEGFERFYDFQEGQGAPVGAWALSPRDDRWLRERQEKAEADVNSGQTASMELEVQGITCVGCVWLLERLYQRLPGARRIDLDPTQGRVRVLWKPGEMDLPAFACEAQRFGYLLGPPGERAPQSESRQLAGRVGLAGAFALNAMMFTLPVYLGMSPTFPLAPYFGWLTILFSTLAVATGGSYFFARAYRALRAGAMHLDLPIALGIAAAYVGSLAGWMLGEAQVVYFDFVAIFVFLMLAGRWFQERAVERNRRSLLEGGSHNSTVRVKAGDAWQPQPVDTMRAGLCLHLQRGETLPVAARLQGEGAAFSLESICGEAAPRQFQPGQQVPSGAILLDLEAQMEASEGWSQSLYKQLLEALPDVAAGRHAGLEQLLRGYLLTVLLIAFAGALGWALAGEGTAALQVAVSILVVSCPCALGLAWPLATERAIANLRRRGVLVREPSLLGKLLRVRRLVFDKTGTLTLESPRLLDATPLEAMDSTERAALWTMVRDNPHPVSRGLREALLRYPEARHDEPVHGRLREVPGEGLIFEGQSTWALLRPPRDNSAENEGDVRWERDGQLRANFRLVDQPRESAREELQTLRQSGLALQILSGDRTEKVQSLASALGFKPAEALSRQSPTEKEAWVRAHDPEGILYLGDGANDALAFNAAACRGTPVADRSLLASRADFFLLGHDLRGLRHLLQAARWRQAALRRVFTFATLYNIATVGYALAGMMHPLLAAILMPLSSVLTLALIGLPPKEDREG